MLPKDKHSTKHTCITEYRSKINPSVNSIGPNQRLKLDSQMWQVSSRHPHGQDGMLLIFTVAIDLNLCNIYLTSKLMIRSMISVS